MLREKESLLAKPKVLKGPAKPQLCLVGKKEAFCLRAKALGKYAPRKGKASGKSTP